MAKPLFQPSLSLNAALWFSTSLTQLQGLELGCEKSQNSVTGLSHERRALVTPNKVYSGIGCDSCEQIDSICDNKATVIHFLTIQS